MQMHLARLYHHQTKIYIHTLPREILNVSKGRRENEFVIISEMMVVGKIGDKGGSWRMPGIYIRIITTIIIMTIEDIQGRFNVCFQV